MAETTFQLKSIIRRFRAELEKTGFRYLPTDDDLHFDSLWLGPSLAHPEWNSYFWIQIQVGSGFSSGSWTMDKAAIGDIRQSIGDSCEMYYAATASGLSSMEEVERFLDIACLSLESS